jgi:hypothetical protein
VLFLERRQRRCSMEQAATFIASGLEYRALEADPKAL